MALRFVLTLSLPPATIVDLQLGFTPLATKVDKTCSLPKATSVANIMFISGLFQKPDCAKTRGKTRHWHRVLKNIRQQKS